MSHKRPVNNIGVSEITPIKQQHFRIIVRTHLTVTQAIFRKMAGKGQRRNMTYYYFDINAGRGIVNGEVGSPLIFLEEVSRIDMKYSAVFIEEKKENALTLQEAISEYPHVEVVYGKQAKELSCYGFHDTSWRYGLLYTDPNGIFNEDILQSFSQQPCFHAIDLLINCNSTAIKRSRKAFGYDYTLEDRIRLIKKSHWLVRDCLGRWQWTMLLGTNWNQFPKFRSINMFPIQSREGQAFFARANLTKEELKQSPLLEMTPLHHHRDERQESFTF